MLVRTPEPELMDDAQQALAYARADFTEPHENFILHFKDWWGSQPTTGLTLDLGCGPGDITLRFARHFPRTRLLGIDGAATMIDLARKMTATAQLDHRVRFHCQRVQDLGVIPGVRLILSNSLLHHLFNPMDLWLCLKKIAPVGTALFLMDLMRPRSQESAQHLVAKYCSAEAVILQRDFYASLLAAFQPEEVAQQLKEARLDLHIKVISDRHFIIYGYL